MPAAQESNGGKKRRLEQAESEQQHKRQQSPQKQAPPMAQDGVDLANGATSPKAGQGAQDAQEKTTGAGVAGVKKGEGVGAGVKQEVDPAAALKKEVDTATLEREKSAMRRLLEPFSREQLVEILASAATQYDALYTELKAVASADVTLRKVFVRGLAWETKTEHLKEAFAAFGDVQEGAVIYDKTTGKSRGFGFITFEDMEAAQRAIKQQIVLIDGRKTTCNLASQRSHGDDHQHPASTPSSRQHQQDPQTARGPTTPRSRPSHMDYTAPGSAANPMHPVSAMPPASGSGVPPPPPQQPQLQPPPQQSSRHSEDTADRKLFVRGLPWDSSDDALRREFQKFGELEEAAVARDRSTGKSKGFGFVTYKHKAAADRALQTPQKYIDGRSTFCNLACQGSNRSHGDRGGSAGLLAPVAPAAPNYSMPMVPVGMYAGMPYATSAPGPPMQPPMAQPMAQQPMPYGQYPGMPRPYAQPPQQPQQGYPVAPAPYYQSRPQPPPQQPQPPAPPRRS